MLYETRPQITTPGQGVDILFQAEVEAEQLEARLKLANAYIHELETKILVEIFDAADQVEATAAQSGAKAKKKLHIEGSLPKVDDKATGAELMEQISRRAAAIALCSSYGWDPLIKTKITAAWDKGDREKALALYEQLRKDNSVILQKDESIHASTLKSMARKRLEEGKSLDPDTLGLTALPAVKLTKRPKTH